MSRSPIVESAAKESVPVSSLTSFLDLLEDPILVSDRGGKFLLANLRGKERLTTHGFTFGPDLNLFADLLQISPKAIEEQIESGKREIDSRFECCSGAAIARIQWVPDADWLVVSLDGKAKQMEARATAASQHTVQELLQEREITYRNLLAAYLRLQEVNRQKTVFLASAAHELKTPLAVIKGYYDLLLSGSLGKLTDKQRDILQESKESCERLVRLVSMFLNYSALESGKLVLHLRENDLRDCLGELATRWREAFRAQAGAVGDTLDSNLPIFKFDYQKVQQTVANLLDNALKHTPAGGNVICARNPISGSGARRKNCIPGAAPRTHADANGSQGFSFGLRAGHRLRTSPGNFRGFCARGPQFVRHGTWPGHCQKAGAGASRQDLGG